MDDAHVVAVCHDAHNGTDELGGVTLAVVPHFHDGVKQLSTSGHLLFTSACSTLVLHLVNEEVRRVLIRSPFAWNGRYRVHVCHAHS